MSDYDEDYGYDDEYGDDDGADQVFSYVLVGWRADLKLDAAALTYEDGERLTSLLEELRPGQQLEAILPGRDADPRHAIAFGRLIKATSVEYDDFPRTLDPDAIHAALEALVPLHEDELARIREAMPAIEAITRHEATPLLTVTGALAMGGVIFGKKGSEWPKDKDAHSLFLMTTMEQDRVGGEDHVWGLRIGTAEYSEVVELDLSPEAQARHIAESKLDKPRYLLCARYD